MSTVQALRAFVSQRLAVAVEDIIDMFQRTITEYERELDRQRRLLGAEQPPGVKLTVNGETGVSQDIRSLIIGAKIPTEQQDLNCRLDQEALCIKEEPEELVQTGSVWMRQGMEGADIISQFTLVSVKTEDDEENPQSSQLQQRQTEKQLEADAAQQIEAGAVRESCGGSEPAFDLDVAGFLKATSDGQFFLSQCFKTGTEDLDYDWKQTECRPFPDTLKDDDSVSHQRSHNPKKLFKCPVCRETFKHSTALQRHMTCHTGERPFVCTVCGKTFRQKGSLHIHMRKHTGEKPFSCLVCGKNFTQSGTLSAHMRIHTGEKPFSCSVCKKRYNERGTLVRHMRVHTGEKPFTCSLCGKRFSEKGNLNKHKRIHTGEKPFICSMCEKRFCLLSHLKNHKCPGQKSSDAAEQKLHWPNVAVQLSRHTVSQ